MSSTENPERLNRTDFERLFKTHFAFLCNFAQQYVQDQDTAQEICQRVFITMWEKRAEMDTSRSIKSYLFTSVRNRCLNHIRDQKKYRSEILDLDCGQIDFSWEDSDQFAEAELRKRIENALAGLPNKCRLVFEMSRFRQMRYQDIAEELDISQKTVEAHMSKALKTLKEALKDYHLIMIWWAFWDFLQ